MKKNKYYTAKANAELSLQFYRDTEGTPNFLVTCNPRQEGKDFCTGIDKLIFAENLVNCGMVSFTELVFLCDFFEAVRREIQKKVGSPRVLKEQGTT